MPPMKRPHTETDPEVGDTLALATVANRWQTTQAVLRAMMGEQEIGFVQIRQRFRIPVGEVERIEQSVREGEFVIATPPRKIGRRQPSTAKSRP